MATRAVYTGNGIGFFDTDAKDAMWRTAPHPLLVNPLRGHGDFDDFHSFTEDDWMIAVVSVGAGDSTIAMTDREGGWVRVACGTNENDGAQAQLMKSNFRLASTNQFWIDFRIDLTEEITQCDAFVGLAISDTTVLAGVPADIAYWHKDDGDTNWDFTARKNSTSTDADAEVTAALDTPVILGFSWNGATLYP